MTELQTEVDDVGLVNTAISTNDWLARTIVAVKALAAGAEFIPFPYVRGAFGSVIVLLETVDQMKRNRDELRELCANVVDIVFLIQKEISVHGELTDLRMTKLCQEFTLYLKILQMYAERMMGAHRRGFKGWLRDFLRVEDQTEQLTRYRRRLDHLRNNFILALTMSTNFNVADMRRTGSGSATTSRETSLVLSEFRQISLGDVNLLYEVSPRSASRIKIFIARVSEQYDLKTVAQYDDTDHEANKNVAHTIMIRNPYVMQLFGFIAAPGFRGLIFHDEIIPLATYRQFHRPSADLVWAAVEGLLFQQFKETAQYHYWPSSVREERNRATICVKQRPLRLCLTMPDIITSQPSLVNLDTGLSSWHNSWFRSQRSCHEIPKTDCNILGNYLATELSSAVIQRIDLEHFLATLLPIYFTKSVPLSTHEHLLLGSVVGGSYHQVRPNCFIPLSQSFIPDFNTFSIQHWQPQAFLGAVDRESAMANRFTFGAGSFKAGEIASELIHSTAIGHGPQAVGLAPSNILFQWSIGVDDSLANRSNICWLSQANNLLRDFTTGADAAPGARYCYGICDRMLCLIVMDVDFHHLLRPAGTLMQTYLFLQSPILRHEASGVGVDFSGSTRWYWSLDPSGDRPMSQAECDALGVPRMRFDFAARGRFWQEYHYNAIRQFLSAKGVDPYSQDVPRMFSVPPAEQ
ncbi:hypothetical protein R3P38DRAFT_2892308 [Favolaschia claudopus]|uniref:Uncharacterized protein n=1 Tax=Favolaschia claudopus TaxID=2862362 RepID=A0AAW0CW46_9AGAR